MPKLPDSEIVLDLFDGAARPYCLCDSEKRILWTNEAFRSLVHLETGAKSDQSLTALLSESGFVPFARGEGSLVSMHEGRPIRLKPSAEREGIVLWSGDYDLEAELYRSAAEQSADVYSAAVNSLNRFSGASLSVVTRLLDEGRSYLVLASAPDDGLAGTILPVEHSPCETVVSSGSFQCYVGDLGERFPKDEALQSGAYEMYAGRVYHNPEGIPLGHTFVLDREAKLPCDYLDWLFVTVGNFIQSELRASYLVDELEQASVRAERDELTGLYNRARFDGDLEEKVKAARDSKGPGCVLAIIDLDGMKGINDSRGHQEGDRLLREFAVALEAAFRAEDRIYRLGGDEFAVIASVKRSFAEAVGRRIGAAISTVREDDIFSNVGASFGSASATEAAFSAEKLYALADKRMYTHKRSAPDRPMGRS